MVVQPVHTTIGDQLPGIAPADCASSDPATITGNGPGSTDSGPAAILGSQHAYHSQRDGHAARRYITDTTAITAD